MFKKDASEIILLRGARSDPEELRARLGIAALDVLLGQVPVDIRERANLGASLCFMCCVFVCYCVMTFFVSRRGAGSRGATGGEPLDDGRTVGKQTRWSRRRTVHYE